MPEHYDEEGYSDREDKELSQRIKNRKFVPPDADYDYSDEERILIARLTSQAREALLNQQVDQTIDFMTMKGTDPTLQIGTMAAGIVQSMTGAAKDKGRDIPSRVQDAVMRRTVQDLTEVAVKIGFFKPKSQAQVNKALGLGLTHAYGTRQRAGHKFANANPQEQQPQQPGNPMQPMPQQPGQQQGGMQRMPRMPQQPAPGGGGGLLGLTNPINPPKTNMGNPGVM